jgi:menaquinone-9 beta-reductase
MKEKYDLIVVGGGPGGATCAAISGSKGKKVLILEKETFPRNKTCGDAVSRTALLLLKELGLEKEFLALIHEKGEGVILNLFSNELVTGKFFKENHSGAICKRIFFDNLLFNHAKKYAEVKEGFKVVDLLFEGEHVVGVKGISKEGESLEILSKVVIGADGANSVVSKKLGQVLMDPNHTAVAIRGYYNNLPTTPGRIELHFLKNLIPGYFWIFPTGGPEGEANVGLGMLSSSLRGQKMTMKEQLNEVLTELPQFKERFKGSCLQDPVLGFSLPMRSKKRKLAFSGALLIGDAAGLINPFTGEGIAYAMISGKVAAEFLNPLLEKDQLSYRELSKFQKVVEKEFYFNYKVANFLQKMFYYPFYLKLLPKILSKSDIIKDKVISYIMHT